MQKTLLTKLLAVVALTALIGIALLMIQSTIAERTAYHAQAVQSIAADSVRQQSMTGPIMVVPYTESFDDDETPDGDKPKRPAPVRTASKRVLVFPNGLQIKGRVDTDNRYRGIHKVLVYSGQFSMEGDFILPAQEDLPRERANSHVKVGQPFVALGIDDVRGIRNIPQIEWNGRKIDFEQGSGLAVQRAGLHAPVPVAEWKRGEAVRFNFNLGLDGIERLQFTPVAKNNLVTLESKWPHPQFGGRFMPSPKDRAISSKGFIATWNISSLATNAQQQIAALERGAVTKGGAEVAAAPAANIDSFSVGFIEPVNIYSQADRAVKYGLLFVSLTFAAFFLFEVLKRLPIHPIQYALVGIALALFFLLLVSLSEHISFELAYLVASGACILLIGFYLSFVLQDWKRGFAFGTGLTVLYGVLFGLLRSEDNALLMGSILLFAVLALVMVATRKVDWYRVGAMAGDFAGHHPMEDYAA